MFSKDFSAGQVFSYIFEVIFIYLVVYYFFFGIKSLPFPGDNWDYHIPIAQMFITGEIINPDLDVCFKCAYPGVSEALLAIFMFFGIPLNLYNVLGIIIFYFVLRRTGSIVLNDPYYSGVFASSVCSLTIIAFRMFHSQSIDVYIAVYFFMLLNLLLRFDGSYKSYLFAGVLSGFIIGTKYTGFLYVGALGVIFLRVFFKNINFKKILLFLIPVFVFGASWFFRNYIIAENPFYPHGRVFFKGPEGASEGEWYGWSTLLMFPKGLIMLINASISEYRIWSIAIPFFPVIVFAALRISDSKIKLVLQKLLLLSFFSFLIFMSSPSWYEYDPLVSSFRYSFAAIALLMLSVFVLAKHFGYLPLVSALSFVGFVSFPSLQYYPKIVFITAVISIFVLYKKYNLFRNS